MVFPRLQSIFGFVVVLLCIAGCDTKKVTEAVTTTVDAAKNTVNQTVETVKQEANLAGSMDLSTSPPLATSACYATLVVTGGERPNVLQLASYKDADLERFPSMFIKANVKANSLQELVGQSLQAEFYAQAVENGTAWHTRTGSPASVTISAVDETSLTAVCNGVKLINAETGEETTVNGKFVALFE
jgi:hypothetical protein